MKRAVCLEYDGQKILAYTTGQSIITLCDFYAMGLPDQWWPNRIADMVVDHEAEKFISVDPQYNPDWKRNSILAVLPVADSKSFFHNLTAKAVKDEMSLQGRSELEHYWEYVTEDNTAGFPEDCNGGHYRWYDQLGIRDGRFFYRSVASFHGDLEPFPDFQEINGKEFAERMADAVAAERDLYPETVPDGTIRKIK